MADRVAGAAEVGAAGEGAELALSVSGLTKSFGATRALDEVTLEVRAGEVHALMGQNGSGKSTLVKVLAGFHRPDHAVTARSCDTEFAAGDAPAAKAAGVRFIHQDLGLVESLSGLDNLALGVGYATARGVFIKWREQRAAARREVAELGYAFDVNRPVGELEPVERTAIAIARAIRDVEGVRLLVLDEPTATMPGPDMLRLHELVRQVRDRGVGVIYVSHHINEVMELADRVTVLRDGRRVATASTAELTPRSLVALMTGDDEPKKVDSTVSVHGDRVMKVSGLGGQVVESLDLELRRGEVVGIAGIEGSGRGEVSGLIFGERPRAGTVHIGDAPLEELNPRRAVELGVGFVPADRATKGLHMAMSITENMTLPDLAPHSTGGWLRRRGERAAATQLSSRFAVRMRDVNAEVQSLSGGNQQKVLMAKWLRMKPRVLLLDEPTQGVDVKAKHDIHAQVHDAAREGAGVVVCSSDEQELEQLCDRVIVLRHGKASVQLKGSDLTAGRIVAECLLGTEEELENV